MKTSKFGLAVALGLVGLVAPRATRADNILQVTISNLTFNGNNACGPSGTALCTQTLSESYQWDNTTQTYVSGTLSFSTAGVLGTSFAPSSTFPFPFTNAYSASTWVQSVLQDPNGDLLTVNLGNNAFLSGASGPNHLVTGTYTVVNNTIATLLGTFNATLSCASALPSTCTTAYPPTPGGNLAFSTGGTVTVTTVPEPPTSITLSAGLLCLMGMTLFWKCAGLAAPRPSGP